MSDSFRIEEQDGISCLHVTLDRSLLFEDEHADLGTFHAYFPLDDIQSHCREQYLMTLDLANAIMQRANASLRAIEKATESDWDGILAGGLEDIVKMCQAQFLHVQTEVEKT